MSGARTAGPHFFLAPADLGGDRAVLRGDEARHLAVVLRARPGDPVSLADGAGVVCQARVERAGDEVILRIVERFVEDAPSPLLTVVHALPKGRKLDEVVQRLTELGVDRIVPVHSRRSQVRLDGSRAARAVERWRAVALAAAKQSRRARLPEVAAVGEWATAFAHGTGGVVLWEEATTPLSVALGEPASAGTVVLGVGPEGGLTAGEVEATGLPAASLGPTVLRTETAALVAATVVLHRLGRVG